MLPRAAKPAAAIGSWVLLLLRLRMGELGSDKSSLKLPRADRGWPPAPNPLWLKPGWSAALNSLKKVTH